jgi:hypothetical protein
MSIFRDAVAALAGKEAVVLIGGAPLKVTVKKVNGDLVILDLAAPAGGAKQIALHIDAVQLVTA